MIEIWQSSSCNNSSRFRIVAKFADAATAESARSDLAERFPVHAAAAETRVEYSDDPTQATLELGEKDGFEWDNFMAWGAGGLGTEQLVSKPRGGVHDLEAYL